MLDWAAAISATSSTGSVTRSTRAGNASTSRSTFCSRHSSGKPFSHEGKYYSFDETSIFPMPVQQPHPPIWAVAQSPESIVATAQRGFNLISGGFGIPIERLAVFRETLDRTLSDHPQREAIRVRARSAPST